MVAKDERDLAFQATKEIGNTKVSFSELSPLKLLATKSYGSSCVRLCAVVSFFYISPIVFALICFYVHPNFSAKTVEFNSRSRSSS